MGSSWLLHSFAHTSLPHSASLLSEFITERFQFSSKNTWKQSCGQHFPHSHLRGVTSEVFPLLLSNAYNSKPCKHLLFKSKDSTNGWNGRSPHYMSRSQFVWQQNSAPFGNLLQGLSMHLAALTSLGSAYKEETLRLPWQAQIHFFKPMEVNTCIFPLLTSSDNIREIIFSSSTISAIFPGIAGEDKISGMMHEKSAWQLLFPRSSAPKYFAPSPGFPCVGFPGLTKGKCPPAMCPSELGRGSRLEILWTEKNKFETINEEDEMRLLLHPSKLCSLCWKAWTPAPALRWEIRLVCRTHMKEGRRTESNVLFFEWLRKKMFLLSSGKDLSWII